MLRIRALTPEDVDRADEVARTAFQVDRSFRPRFLRYLEIQPDGWLVAEDDIRVIGTVGVVAYHSFGYLGLLAVDPAWQGQGLGRRLLEAALQILLERGAECAALDASDAGRRLYERAGFEGAGPSVVLVLGALPGGEPSGGGPIGGRAGTTSGSMAVDELTTEASVDRADLVALDGELFGADRARVWRTLLGAPGTRAWLARSPGGEAIGYLCAQEHQLGPWGARTAGAAMALFGEAVAALPPRRWRVQLPGDNLAGRALLTSLGFVEERSLLHMRRGPSGRLPRWNDLYGKGSFCLG